jgi:NAD(P)-dependent dehydrogenase (short-subunit alcohol dehydrogenase family)
LLFQLADKGIRVNAIAPGIISTDIYEAKEGHQQVENTKAK